MNKKNALGPAFRVIYRSALWARRLLGKRTCRVFDQVQDEAVPHRIERIYVINLDRQPLRWHQVAQELSQVLDASGVPLKMRATRVSAVDALEFENIDNVDAVEQIYSLSDQLYVDPRRVLPERLDLDKKIQMSRQEIAVALSHIKTWKTIASGKDQYALVLEDDVCFRPSFARYVERVWEELCACRRDLPLFDILYLSYKEVDEGAEKTRISENTFQLFRGIWYLSGYVLSKRGAERLLSQLPVRGPVDLWINHKFSQLDALVTSKSVIAQRLDETSVNSYSILPVLSKIGVLNSEFPGVFHTMQLVKPVFAVGNGHTGLTSLGMALSMLGYRCCCDLDELPEKEKQQLLRKDGIRKFDAYINVGSLDRYLNELAALYPGGRLILMTEGQSKEEIAAFIRHWSARVLLISPHSGAKWKMLCEFLGIVPPASPYPSLFERGQRRFKPEENSTRGKHISPLRWLEADSSPWIISPEEGWQGVPATACGQRFSESKNWVATISDNFNIFDDAFWFLRDDTFPGNLALFSPSNFSIDDGAVAKITVRHEDMGVRQYSSGALTTSDSFLFGRFEAVLKPPRVAGLITGMFLHRDSPRQEIDIEFLGKDPRKLLINVYYNPGSDGSRFDYGFRGTPVLIDLGFDATSDFHSYAMEWMSDELRWYVDGELVHRRVNWDPTPIPHLPMRFHINSWPSMSHELAGSVDKKLLPATAQVQSVHLWTTSSECLGSQNDQLDSIGEKTSKFEKIEML